MDVGRRRVHRMAMFSVFFSLVSFITPGYVVPQIDIVVSLITSSMAVHHTSSNARLREATSHQSCGRSIAGVHGLAISGAVLSVLFGLIGRPYVTMMLVLRDADLIAFILGMLSALCTLINVVILISIASYTRSDRNSCTSCCAPPSAVLGDVSPDKVCVESF